MHPDIPRRHELRACLWLAVLVTVLHPASAHASLFHGETLDAIANGISWVAIVIAPIIGMAIFWLVHILPRRKSILRLRRSSAYVCSRFALADCSGPWRGFGLTRSQCCTSSLMAPTWTKPSAITARRKRRKARSSSCARASPNSNCRPAAREGSRNGTHPVAHLLVLRLADLLQVQVAALGTSSAKS